MFAASAGLTSAAVGEERKAPREVCLDEGNAGHERDETADGADSAVERSVIPTPIDLRIAIKGAHGYSDSRLPSW